MASRYYDLPSLKALAVFEASARHQSFKRAAAELNVTPGAVSRQIKAIEDELGAAMFVRGKNGVEITSEGHELYSVLAHGFARASEVARRIRMGSRGKTATIACSNAFATMWLIPRMNNFWQRYPDISVDHLISDDARDYRRVEVDLRIRYGSGAWPDETGQVLFDETIYPVCGKQFAQAHAELTAHDLPTLPLLHVDWVDTEWTDWDEMLRRGGVPHGPLHGRRFSKFSVALMAAEANQGVAVGWDRLVRPLINEGKLVRFTELSMPAPGSYYLTWNESRGLSEAANLLRRWLEEISVADDDGMFQSPFSPSLVA